MIRAIQDELAEEVTEQYSVDEVCRQKTTRTKSHHRRNFAVYFDELCNHLASKKFEKFQ